MKKLMLYSVLAVALLSLAAIVFHRSHNHVEAAHHHAGPQAAAGDEPGLQRAECLEWVAETYRLETLATELDLDLAQDSAELRACMAENVRHMAVPIPIPWCDNIFKIHCSGLDLLGEVGEALADRCESQLAGSLDSKRKDYRKLRACLRDSVYERYSLRGETSDRKTCRTLFARCAVGSE